MDPLLKRYINASKDRLSLRPTDESRQELLTGRSYSLTRGLLLLVFLSYLIYVLISGFVHVAETYPDTSFVMYALGYLTYERTFVTLLTASVILLAFIHALRHLTRENCKSVFWIGLGAFILWGVPTGLFFGEYERSISAIFVSMLSASVYLYGTASKVRVSGSMLPIGVLIAVFAAFWGIAAIGNEFGMTGDGSLYWFVLGLLPVVVFVLPAVLIVSAIYAFTRWMWTRAAWPTMSLSMPLRTIVVAIVALGFSIALNRLIRDEAILFVSLPGLLLVLLSIAITDKLASKWRVRLPGVWIHYISPTSRWVLSTLFIAALLALFLADRLTYVDWG